MIVTLSDGTALELRDGALSQGAEGEVFLSKDGKYVVKHYWRPEPWREQALEAIMTRYSAVKDQNPDHQEYWSALFCWPDGIVKSPWFGVRMPCAPRGLRKPLDLLMPKFRKKNLKPDELGSWAGHLSIAAKLARIVRRMHQLGLCHSDLSWNNMLVDPRDGRMCLIDCDGLVVPGFLPPTVLGTPQFMAPEVVAGSAKPSTRTDLHALAVLIYLLLLFAHPLEGKAFHSPDSEEDDRLRYGEKALFREHLTDRRNAPRDMRAFRSCRLLGPELERLCHRAFVDGLHQPMQRPAAGNWEQALLRTADRLIPCLNPACDMKTFPFIESRALQCPWCGYASKKTGRTRLPFRELPVLRMYRPISGRVGQFQDEGYDIVAWPGRTLHAWHADPTLTPGPGVDHTPLARCLFEKGKWLITNDGLASLWRQRNSEGRQQCQLGNSVELSEGMRLFFGQIERGRVGIVRVVRFGS